MSSICAIIPPNLLKELAKKTNLSKDIRKFAHQTNQISAEHRKVRTQALALTKKVQLSTPISITLSSSPAITVYDCKNSGTLQGTPAQDTDPVALQVSKQTAMVATFYKNVFGRNSIDDAGMTIVSSIHYSTNYTNAHWNGFQMIYGDGDAQLYTNFSNASDVICHELTHGVLQFTLKLKLVGETGGLNESISDCFGSMFRQWQANQNVKQADWLIGSDVLGPLAIAEGYRCLRDMADPGASHCMNRQPNKYSMIHSGMSQHESGGPPNLAFYVACMSVGGKSWENVGKIWYMAIKENASPNMTMKDFADRTRDIANKNSGLIPGIVAAIDKGWKHVGL